MNFKRELFFSMKSKFNDWGRVDRGVLLILKIVLELGMGERLEEKYNQNLQGFCILIPSYVSSNFCYISKKSEA